MQFAYLLIRICSRLIAQPNVASLLLQVYYHAAGVLLRRAGYCVAQLLLAVALEAPKHLRREARVVRAEWDLEA